MFWRKGGQRHFQGEQKPAAERKKELCVAVEISKNGARMLWLSLFFDEVVSSVLRCVNGGSCGVYSPGKIKPNAHEQKPWSKVCHLENFEHIGITSR